MTTKYILPALMELPPTPMVESDLLEWAKKTHATLQSSYIPQADRIESMIMSEHGLGLRPTPTGTRRLFYDRDTDVMYIDEFTSATTAEWVAFGGTGLGAFLPLAGGTMLGDILMLDNALIWEDQSATPETYYPVMDWNGLYWEDGATSPAVERFLGLFHDGLRLDDLSKVYYEDTVTGGTGVNFDILWWDYTTPTEEFLTLHSYNDLVLSAGEGVNVGDIILDGNVVLAYLRELFVRSAASTEILAISAEGNKDIEFGDATKTTSIAGDTDRPYYAKGAGAAVELALLSDAGGGIDPSDGFVLDAGADIQFSSTSELQLAYGAIVTAENQDNVWTTILKMDSVANEILLGDVDFTEDNTITLLGAASRFAYVDTTTSATDFIAYLSDLPGGLEKSLSINDAMYEFALADGLPNKYLTYVGGVLDLIEIYDYTPTKRYEKQFNYTGGILTSIVLERMSDSATWTKTLTYDTGVLTEVEAA